MIEQIRDLLIDIEDSDSKSDKIKYSLEVCSLVFENTALDEKDYKNLESEDIIVESVQEIDVIVKYSSDFLEHSLKYLEADLKGDDFEIAIQENLKQLQALNIKFTSSSKKYKELKTTQKEIEKIQSEMLEIQLNIDEYEQIDLEKVWMEREVKLKKLAELERTEGDNLQSYKRHIAENQKIAINCMELVDISKKIKTGLTEMDEILKKTTIKGSLNG